MQLYWRTHEAEREKALEDEMKAIRRKVNRGQSKLTAASDVNHTSGS